MSLYRHKSGLLFIALFALLALFQANPVSASSGIARSIRRPHALGTRQHAHSHNSSSLPLEYNNGPVMRQTSITYAIFWEPATLQDGTPTRVSANYHGLIERYFADIGGSGIYSVNTQYYDGGGSITNSSSFGGAWVDTSAYPSSDCNDSATPNDCMSDGQFQLEVLKAMQANGWSGGLNHMFFVFTSLGEGSCVDTASSACSFTQYCAYHSAFQSSDGQTVIYANMPYAGTSLDGCGVSFSPNNDIDADSTINVLSHEHMEAVTDPLGNAWYDALGDEIGDKCAWNFGTPSLDNGQADVQWNNHYYLEIGR